MDRIIGDVEDLLAAVEHTARAEAQAIAQEADTEVGRLEQEAEAEARRERRRIRADAEAQARSIRQRRQRRRERDDRRLWLEVREEIFDRVWDRARERLAELAADDDAHAAALGRLAVLGARILGPGEYTLAGAGPGHDLIDKKRCKEWSGQASGAVAGDVAFTPADAAAGGEGGLVVHAGPNRRVDLTFAARLGLARDELRDQVFARLTAS